ncbi:hypothetical protein FRC12_024580 [Ceratobasidium sp. 428]|nr:hypothetical protein FRC12_024580 [Ceratobasidium sp. 428]
MDDAPPLAILRYRPDLPNYDREYDSTAELMEPFPQETDISHWDVFRDLVSIKVPTKELPHILKSRTAHIEHSISMWQRKTEAFFASLVRQELLYQAIRVPQVIRDSCFYAFRNPSEDAVILLRADSFFCAASGLDGYAYSYGNTLKLPRSTTDQRFSSPEWQLAAFSLHSRAFHVARALLQEIGRPDASFLELHEIRRFSCGRCESYSLLSWEEIVNHYVSEQTQWEKRKARTPPTEPEPSEIHIHDLAPQDKPLVELVTRKEYEALGRQQTQRKYQDFQRSQNKPNPDQRYIIW